MPRKPLKKISEPLCLGVVLGVLAAQKGLSPRAGRLAPVSDRSPGCERWRSEFVETMLVVRLPE
jgi:hypothetical protein